MKQYVFFDTETTGIKKTDEVIQLGLIVTDENLNIKHMSSDYCYTKVPINKEAENVHGISREFLFQNYRNQFLEDLVFNKYKNIFNNKDNVYIAFGCDFDKRLVDQTLINNCGKTVDFGYKLSFKRGIRHNLPTPIEGNNQVFCAREYLLARENKSQFTRGTKLVDFCKSFPESSLQKLFIQLCNDFKIDDRNRNPHDALYDTFLMFICIKYADNLLDARMK